uniref:ubiquitinyl hydrolase 1 n=1 Tax=Amblyomma cajennense TaxID=34607 RepID=A0A023FEE4_AMBCJ
MLLPFHSLFSLLIFILFVYFSSLYFLQSYAIPLVRETGKKDELVIGSAYDPEPFRDLLMKIKPDCKKGKQEDAEEFLSFMLNGLHDEMVSSMRSVSNGHNGQCNGEAQASAERLDDEDDDEGPWKTVSHRNRYQVTRSAEYSNSPLMDIFGGEMRSSVTADGETSASLQPFFTLQLDIQDGVKTVEEALLHLAAEEKVHNYHSSKSNKEVRKIPNVPPAAPWLPHLHATLQVPWCPL